MHSKVRLRAGHQYVTTMGSEARRGERQRCWQEATPPLRGLGQCKSALAPLEKKNNVGKHFVADCYHVAINANF